MPFNLKIPGQVSIYQLQAIEIVAELVPKEGQMVEVGSLFGCSSWAWAKSVDPSVIVHCFDPWVNTGGVRAMEQKYGVKYGLDQFLEYTKDCPNIRPHQGYSPTDFLDWKDEIDLYYEDAVHGGPILSQNLEFWTSKLRHPGIICGDDYRPRFPDVRAGAEALARKYNRELIVVDFFWCLLPGLTAADQVAASRLRALSSDAVLSKKTSAPGNILIGVKGPIGRVEQGTSPILTGTSVNDGVEVWPPSGNGKGLTVGLRVVPEANLAKVVAEGRLTLGGQLEPDIAREFAFTLPTNALPPGRYRIILDYWQELAGWLKHSDSSMAGGHGFEIV